MKTVPGRKFGLRLAVVLGIAAAVAVIAPTSPASAASGCNNRLCISTDYFDNPEDHLGLIASPFLTGYYHTHIWGGGNDFNTPEQYLVGGNIYSANPALPRPIAKGTTICAELWVSIRGGTAWQSWGLPCITH